ncbi:ABC transporter substrate-binding protein [Rarobacter incanus]|uniref:Amino acid ABC transporter substrate-binding protein (PAAT family) n=1 Tax=Rarobacter incanus TaxID=153494 RepID=A0A542SPW2_9MICO|nr:ABC transporter substrate-binding protein [Rarobacter incanus]TQK76661.1 amino acid ABC transporter substrate-binding protein (PAAT family) [Rarobacter incanus]
MRKIILTAVALGALLTLTACGGGGEATTTATSTASATASAKDDTIAALVPETISATGKLVVGSDTSYAPAEFLDEDGKTPIGYDVEIADAIAAVMGLKADVQSSSFDAIIPAVGSKYDIGISSFTVNPERMQQVNMVSYLSAGSAFAVAKGNPKGLTTDDLCGLVIGVQTGTTQDDYVKDTVIPACEKAGKTAPTPLQYDLQTDVTTALLGGKADVMAADSPVIAYAVAQTGDKLEQLGDIFDTAPQAVVVSKSDEKLTEAVQAALQKIIDNGTYGKILDKWGMSESAVATAEINPAS